jgi:hypothetical protein
MLKPDLTTTEGPEQEDMTLDNRLDLSMFPPNKA